MSGFLAPQRLFLIVQEKPNCTISETRLSGFQWFKPPDMTSRFSHFSLSLTQEQP
jgi:hypothetical protein